MASGGVPFFIKVYYREQKQILNCAILRGDSVLVFNVCNEFFANYKLPVGLSWLEVRKAIEFAETAKRGQFQSY
jgi:hypothetical protein